MIRIRIDLLKIPSHVLACSDEHFAIWKPWPWPIMAQIKFDDKNDDFTSKIWRICPAIHDFFAS